ncbi:hypothetical protein [Alkaliphilus peptidifermentans]|uniref:Nitrogen regulatory protein P-II family n=1 Tax=Alkaliphilus peptidifermentans DSM 18978 TaxID=1120976 RepID=A0A1G5C1Y0_9FIRM|nr:hypothetical protein [Alkaliphilus peptidifermentans]SCX96294.1 nitrogen regulatory protein P-II family [Alkaliphilus peptidifermentans DSM 18978]
MNLLIAIINDPDRVIDILDEFYEVDIKGATVMESKGMAHIMADHVPFFSRFAEFGKDPAQNKTIFVVIDSDESRKKAIDAIERIVGDLNKPDTGIVMTLPIDFCKGLVKTEGDESLR